MPVLVAAGQRLPPRLAATIVLLRAGQSAPEVLLMRRGQSALHFGGAFVFPGGLLENSDSQPRVMRRVAGMTATQANQRLGVTAGGLGHWVAAVRECYEEAGILLALDEQSNPLSMQRLARLTLLRAALNAREINFADLLEQEQLLIPAGQIAYAAHWVTPPTQEHRFDTRFFVAVAPDCQQVQHDNAELVESLWLTPDAALSRAKRNLMVLALPTQTLISAMEKFSSPIAALEHTQAMVRVPTVRPCVAQGRNGPTIFRLGDPQYAEIHWVDPQEEGTSNYELQPGVAKPLDRYVTRVLAPNANVMTGPGTNCYLVGERDLAVIDPGPDDPVHIKAIVEAGAGRIRWILLTHTHADHAPAAMALSVVTGARIAGHPAPPAAPHNANITFDRVLTDGELVQLDGCALRAIYTPGHASNHICYLLDPTRMLFSGDHVVQGFTVVIAPPDGNMRQYLQSLERLAAMDIAILAPGHGYLIGDAADEMRRLIAHRLAREDKVRKAIVAVGGSATAQSLLPRVYADVPVAIHPLAARSLQAHLEKLLEDGELNYNSENWTLSQS